MTRADTLAALQGDEWVSWPPERKKHLLQLARAEAARRRRARWVPYPWQRPHTHPEGWPAGPCTEACNELPPMAPLGAHEVFAIYGGRGIGKTDGGSNYVLDHVAGPACDPRVAGGHRIAIVAPTIGDAAESCVNGPSGLRAYDPRVQLVGSRGGTFARFPNGARARLFGAHSPNDVERFRSGGNNCLVWVEEAGAQRYLADVLHHSAFGLRVGPSPHYVLTTTPKPRKELRELIHDGDRTHVQRGKTRDAIHLVAAVRQALEKQFAGTRLGRQELDGDELLDVEGALWTQVLIEDGRYRLTDELPPMRAIVVAIDPNAGGPDECGIVVVGVARDLMPDKLGRLVEHYFVLDDLSDKYPHPGAWAAAAVKAYRDWQADHIVAEVNNGGDMVPHTVHTIDPSVPCRTVHATRGKARRAEPVVALYEQERVHHVGAFPQLEDQMTSWTDAPSDPSPDRMDANVWGITDLALPAVGATMFAVV